MTQGFRAALTAVLSLISWPIFAALAAMSIAEPASAIAPYMGPPCPKALDSQSVAKLVDTIRTFARIGSDSTWLASCASDTLSRRRQDVAPALIPLMESGQKPIEYFALRAVCGPGHSGASALPYIENRLHGGDEVMAQNAYRTLACMGKSAKPALPLLMSKSRSIDIDFAFESEEATKALAELGKYFPKEIIPHLIQLLDEPSHAANAAQALGKIGPTAHSAEPALHRSLASAMDAGRDEAAAALISALAVVGEPHHTVEWLIPMLYRHEESTAVAAALGHIGPTAQAAIPALVEHFNAPDTLIQERRADLWALLAIDGRARPVLEATLDAVTSGVGKDDGTTTLFIHALQGVNPFPADLAPRVITAMAALDAEPLLRTQLAHVLAHTGTSQELAEPTKSVSTDVTDRIGDSLLALTTQTQPIAMEDLVAQLHVDVSEYEHLAASNVWLRRKWDAGGGVGARDPVNRIELHEVEHYPHRVDSLSSASEVAAEQKVELLLNSDVCVSAQDLRARLAKQESLHADALTVAVMADRSPHSDGLIVDGDHSPDKSKARSSTLTVGNDCARRVLIQKWFDGDYWSYVCPLTQEEALTDTVILPALKKELGSDTGQYDLTTPYMFDAGRWLTLTYKRRPVSPVQQSVEASVTIDRCSHHVTRVIRAVL